MRKAFFILLLSAYSLQPTAFSQSVIRSLAWELDTARPAAQEWQLVRGETVDLECRYLSGSSAMDVRGAAVVLHCRTNGMPADLSFQVTGRVGRVSSTNLASVGWVSVRVRPDLDLPHDVTRCAFALETTLDAARNLVATGTLRLSGDPTGASPAALPLFQYDALGSAQTVSNALAEAVQLVITSSVPAQIQAATAPLATTQQVAAAAVISSALATQRVERVWAPDGTEYRDGTGGVWRAESVAGGWTLDIPALGLSSPISGLAFPVATNWNGSGSGWTISVAPGGTGYNISVTTGFGEWGATDAQSESPIMLAPISQGADGPATLTYSTNSVNWSHADTVELKSTRAGPRLDLIEAETNKWRTAYGWGNHSQAGYATRAEIPAIVLSNSVSQMVIWTNAAGAATSWWQVASGVTNSGSFASGTPGAITNGAEHVEFGASSPFSGYPNFNPPDSALSIFAPAKFIYVDSNVGGFWGIKFRGTGGGGFTDIFGFTANGHTGEIQLGSRWPTYYMSLMSGGETRVTLKKDGKVGIGTTEPSENFEVVGSCKSSGTNTAAVVRSQSGIILPHYGTNTLVSLIFTNGTIQAWEIEQ